MRDLIVNSLELLCKICVFLLVAGCTVLAWAITGNPFVTLAALVLSFVASTIIFGLFFVLIDINDNMRKLRYQVEKNSEPPPVETKRIEYR